MKGTYSSKHVFNSWHEEEAADKSDSIERNFFKSGFADCLVKVYIAKFLNCSESTWVKMVLLIALTTETIFSAYDILGCERIWSKPIIRSVLERILLWSVRRLDQTGRRDSEILMNMLLRNDDNRASLENRAIFVSQWYTLGRISDGECIIGQPELQESFISFKFMEV